MESDVIIVLYFFAKKEGSPSSHLMTFGTPSFTQTPISDSRKSENWKLFMFFSFFKIHISIRISNAHMEAVRPAIHDGYTK